MVKPGTSVSRVIITRIDAITDRIISGFLFLRLERRRSFSLFFLLSSENGEGRKLALSGR
jgi:hypothetical protein